MADLSARRSILVYADDGAWLSPLVRALVQDTDPRDHDVRLIGARHILDEPSVFENALLLVMPGGADRPYARALNGFGNRRIRAFVESGGRYLGICAGGYYASRRIRFQGGGESPLIDEPRELALFSGAAIGSIAAFGPLYDMTKRSASTPAIAYENGLRCHAYYNGGPYYVPDLGSEARVIARYPDLPGDNAAIVEQKVGDGYAVLVGVHLEVSAGELAGEIAGLTDGERFRPLVESLKATDAARRAVWCDLLARCGVSPAIMASGENRKAV